MGILRFLLALSVVINHSSAIFGFYLVGGRVAVESFFIISGFYMALILSEKYKTTLQGYKFFLTNRILRIYPMYWAMLVITFFAAVGVQFFFLKNITIAWFGYQEPISIWIAIYLVFVHILIFGQDILLFTKYSDTLLIPPSWTLALEMMFYLIAPFLVRWKTWLLILLVGLSIGLRLILYYLGFDYEPWTYRFFPTELAFFVAGIFVFRFYQSIHSYVLLYKKVTFFALATMIWATVFYQYIPTENFKQWAYYALLMAALPFIFELTKNNKKDRRIGEFSYPMYICHIFVLAFVKIVFLPFFHIPPHYFGLITAVFTVALSYILLRYVGDPIERFRHKVLSPQ